MRSEADPFNTEAFPYGKGAGENKGGWKSCPTCGKPATKPTAEEWPWDSQPPTEGVFMFRDELSAKEHYISGMCQACQDSIFGVDQ